MKQYFITALTFLFVSQLAAQTIADSDGNSYNLVTVGTQTWIASNLNVSKFSNGDIIPQATSSIEWNRAREKKQPIWCYLNFDPSTGEKYGKIYNLYAVNDIRGLAPKGYHIPTKDEGSSMPALESKGGHFNSVEFSEIASEGYWWSATSNWFATYVFNVGKWGSTSTDISNSWGWGLYVRCLKGDPIAQEKITPVKATPNNRTTSIKIGTQEWDSKNLNVEKFANGDVIPEAKTFEDWVNAFNARKPAWCHIDLNPENDAAYGKLYNQFALSDPRGIAPKGWHVPTTAEWNVLITKLGGNEEAGLKIKSTNGWGYGNGDDSNGLELTPGGYRHGEGFFDKQGLEGWYWNSSGTAEFLYKSGIREASVYNPGRGYSIRCINNTVRVPEIKAFMIGFGVYSKFGYKVDEKIIIEPKYEMAHDFNEGLGLVQLNGGYGFIDSYGTVVIPLKYKTADNFIGGLAKVELNEKYGLIDKTGKEIIPIKYSRLPGFLMKSGFEEGLIYASLNGKYGFLDKTGKEIIPFTYDGAQGFSNELALVTLNSNRGFINKKGKVVVALIYSQAESFSEGLAAVKLNEKWGFIDRKGKTVIPFIYDEIESFAEGSAIVKLNEKWGLINKTGNIIIPTLYDQIKRYVDEGLRTELAGKWGNIDNTGKETIAPKYQESFYFSEGLAAVKYNNKFGFIDNTGKVVIPFIYDNAGGFLITGTASVEVNGRWFEIDKTGKEVK